MQNQPNPQEAFKKLIQVIEVLRGQDGCPWDQQQTAESMTPYLTEELYELVDAIVKGQPHHICEELGDVLFHIIFIASIFEQSGQFNLTDVIETIESKMIRRHPHVFSDSKAESVPDIKKQWHQIKQDEKKSQPASESVLDSVPVNMPLLMRAYRISQRAAATGFDWHKIIDVMQKVEKKWDQFKVELERACIREDHSPANKQLPPKKLEAVTDEFGDLLFSLVSVARFAGIHPAAALQKATHKFETHFKLMESKKNKVK